MGVLFFVVIIGAIVSAVPRGRGWAIFRIGVTAWPFRRRGTSTAACPVIEQSLRQ
jgi:hypothetical protein